MADGIAVVNSGSSSIKFSLYTINQDGDLVYYFGGQVDGIGVAPRFVAKEADGTVMEERSGVKLMIWFMVPSLSIFLNG